MKKMIIAAVMLLFAATAFAQERGKGTVFQKGTFKELLEKAGKEKKYLFVDVYASWCGPCKIMASQVFPQKSVGEYFNKTFVNAKFDAEKGEGIDIARKYNVRSYPTFLILDSDGTEVGRIIGGAEGDRFVKKVREVVANIDK